MRISRRPTVTAGRSCRLPAAAMVTAAVFMASGCGSGGPTTVPVTGNVSFEGQPVATGEIIFRAIDGQSPSAAGPIHSGHYSLRVTPGLKRVAIIATRETAPPKVGPDGPGEGGSFGVMYVPARYNTRSELTASVTADGENLFDFALDADATKAPPNADR